jgi:hypothetical protein
MEEQIKQWIEIGKTVRDSVNDVMSAVNDLERFSDEVKELQHDESEAKFKWLIDHGYTPGTRMFFQGKDDTINMRVIGYALNDGDVSVKMMWMDGKNSGNTTYINFGRIHGWGKKMTPLKCMHVKIRKGTQRIIKAINN